MRMRWAGLAGLLVTVPLIGAACTSQDYDHDGRRQDGRWERDGRRDRGDRSGASRVRAELVDQGHGVLVFRAFDDGVALVVDVTEDRLLLEVPLRRGDELAVNPGRDDIRVNGRDLYDGNIKRDNLHAIHFAPAGGGGGGGGRRVLR